MRFYFGPNPTHQPLGFQTVTGRKNNFLGRGGDGGEDGVEAGMGAGAGVGVEAAVRVPSISVWLLSFPL